MLTWDDFLAFCDLTEEEVDVIAAHEGLPKVIAAQLGYYLIHSPGGEQRIRSMIAADIERALARRDGTQAAELQGVLRRFDEIHGAAAAAVRH
ncbi:MAG TPA: hypothetical protein VFG47_20340 [Geminicoccaceae bacterium]|nr:hypothetical protein [Geminicoccaceae bacterium]